MTWTQGQRPKIKRFDILKLEGIYDVLHGIYLAFTHIAIDG